HGPERIQADDLLGSRRVALPLARDRAILRFAGEHNDDLVATVRFAAVGVTKLLSKYAKLESA
ncbi:MAG TPA: hypothetical protein VFJ02_18925, partial [Vicinamibacterales bacterium]|nr:hypothetical protein [Vicinamibacterales bacterium]